jgi:hypothetical protein
MKKDGKSTRPLKITLAILSGIIVFEIIAILILFALPRENHSSNRGAEMVLKPILYLYPEATTEVSVTFTHPELLTTTYPSYNNGWNIIAHPDGNLYDTEGKYYYALYWESDDPREYIFQSGFNVSAEESATFLEEKLTKIGLSPRERNEFIMYWLPKMEKNGDNFVYFMLTDEVNEREPLSISPSPDSVLRVRMMLKKTTEKINLPEQILPPASERSGFTAIEWGGVEV